MEKVRDLTRDFSEVEEGVIKAFVAGVGAERIERTRTALQGEVFVITSGMTTIKVEIENEFEDRTILVSALNVKFDEHYIGESLKTAVELHQELEELKQKMNNG